MNQTKYVQELLRSGEIYGSTALVLAVDTWPERNDDGQIACLDWAPMTLMLELESAWGIVPAAITLDKLMAAIAIVTTDLFFKDVKKFIQICNVLSDSPFNPTVFDPADAAEMAWGVSEAVLLVPPDDDPEPFSDEIRAYIGHALKEEGFIKPPDILRVALDADFSSQIEYDYADNPLLFSSIYKTQASKTDEINTLIRENLIELIGQLKSLSLKNGSTEEIEHRLQVMLAASGREDAAA